MPHTMRAALASAQQRARKQRRKEGAHPFFSTVRGAAARKTQPLWFSRNRSSREGERSKGKPRRKLLVSLWCEAKKNRHQHSDPPKNARKNAANPKKSISFPLFLRTKTRTALGFSFSLPETRQPCSARRCQTKDGRLRLVPHRPRDHRCLHHKPTQDEKRAFPKTNDPRERQRVSALLLPKHRSRIATRSKARLWNADARMQDMRKREATHRR